MESTKENINEEMDATEPTMLVSKKDQPDSRCVLNDDELLQLLKRLPGRELVAFGQTSTAMVDLVDYVLKNKRDLTLEILALPEGKVAANHCRGHESPKSSLPGAKRGIEKLAIPRHIPCRDCSWTYPSNYVPGIRKLLLSCPGLRCIKFVTAKEQRIVWLYNFFLRENDFTKEFAASCPLIEDFGFRIDGHKEQFPMYCYSFINNDCRLKKVYLEFPCETSRRTWRSCSGIEDLKLRIISTFHKSEWIWNSSESKLKHLKKLSIICSDAQIPKVLTRVEDIWQRFLSPKVFIVIGGIFNGGSDEWPIRSETCERFPQAKLKQMKKLSIVCICEQLPKLLRRVEELLQRFPSAEVNVKFVNVSGHWQISKDWPIRFRTFENLPHFVQMFPKLSLEHSMNGISLREMPKELVSSISKLKNGSYSTSQVDMANLSSIEVICHQECFSHLAQRCPPNLEELLFHDNTVPRSDRRMYSDFKVFATTHGDKILRLGLYLDPKGYDMVIPMLPLFKNLQHLIIKTSATDTTRDELFATKEALKSLALPNVQVEFLQTDEKRTPYYMRL